MIYFNPFGEPNCSVLLLRPFGVPRIRFVELNRTLGRYVTGLCLGMGLLSSAVRAEVDVESFKQLQSEVLALTESRDTLAGEYRKLRDELAALRAENSELKQRLSTATAREYATRDDLRKVVEQVQEVDKRRAADAALVREKLEELARQLSKPVAIPPPMDPTPTRPPGTGKKATEEATLPSEYYEYTMKEGDILSVVISEYNQSQGLKVRLAQVLKANPNIKDPNRIPVGTKLRIPIVK